MIDVLEGDALELLRGLPAANFDALLSDPPYGLSFMGKAWDHGVPSVDVWREVVRILKPGAPVIAFGGTRTFHRLAVAMEDAGLEPRDCIAWMYGSGFPKSLDVSKAIDAANGDDRPIVGEKAVSRIMRASGDMVSGCVRAGTIEVSSAASAAWDGYGTALKPAYEPALLMRVPLDGTVAHNALTHWCGALAIDVSRIGYASDDDQAAAAAAAAAAQRLCRPSNGVGVGDYGHHGDNAAGSLQPYLDRQHMGRWPANVILDSEAGALLDAQSGDRPGMSGGGAHANGYAGGMFGAIDSTGTARGNDGGASRFFFCAKASRRERELGCDGLPIKTAAERADREEGSPGLESGRSGGGPSSGARNFHPTVKPISLTRYLARLLLPPPRSTPRRILVPYSGSGSEMIGALLAGWDEVVGIEREADYVRIARARLALAAQNPRAFEPDAERAPVADERQVPMFGAAK